MNFSLSSLFITLLISTFLTLVLTFYLRVDRIGKYIKYDYLILIYVFIFIRLLFPVEWTWTTTVPSKIIMPTVHGFFNAYLLGFKFKDISLFIWIAGSLIKIIFLIKDIFNTQKYCKEIIDLSKKIQLKGEHVSEYIRNKVFVDPHIDSPILVNILHPIILIPDISYSDNELKYIVLHENQHIKNKDLFSKFCLELLVSIYWWFPPIYFLKRQMNFLIELKVDNQVTKYLTDAEQLDYLETLISVKKKAEKRKQNLYFELSRQFTHKNKLLLTKRLNIFFDNTSVKKRRWAALPLLFILVLIPFIVLEPYQVDKITEKSTMNPDSLEESFILETIDGRYILYEDNKKIGDIKDPDESPFNDLKIYKEGESK